MDKRDYPTLGLCAIGLGDAVYLTINSYFSKIPLVCPSSGAINCYLVTTSPYSRIFGIHVAVLGLLWFAAITYLALARPSFYPYLLFPLWAAGMAMVVYLVSVEVFILHAICLYCTLAHICTALLGIPVYILTFRD